MAEAHGKLSAAELARAFQEDIYGRTIDVVFFRRLRDEMVFESPEHLADQIRQDLERAKASFE